MPDLYLECHSGISGDMVAGALLDLGVSETYLYEQLATLPLSGWTMECSPVSRQGVAAVSFRVYGEHSAGFHSTEPGHHHAHGRTFPEICNILEDSSISPRAKALAVAVFRALAQAEGVIHGMPMEQVPLQETGADDSILDVAAAAVCLDALSVEQVWVSTLREGCGFTRCAHGRIPVPVPAVLELLQASRLPFLVTDTPGERITPTGAAMAAAWAKPRSQPLTVQRVGIGAGQKEFAHPNVLRAMLVDGAPGDGAPGGEDEVLVLRSAIDDSTPEWLGHCQMLLLEAGALDVYVSPIFMKKNRPAYEMTVLCRPSDEGRMTELLFRETTAIGLRKTRERRNVMERETVPVSVGGVCVDCKVCAWGAVKKCYVEYESAARAARQTGLPLESVYRMVYAAWEQNAGS